MEEERKSIYDDLKRDLRGFPVEEFVRQFAKAYFEGDMETILKLQGLLTSLSPEAGAGGGACGTCCSRRARWRAAEATAAC